MDDERKAHILCPVRGTRRSAPTIDHAIDLALETDGHLSFLFVIDVEFLSHATVGKINRMREELRETAAFVLEFVRARAEKRGLVSIDTTIREGVIDEVIAEVAVGIGATHVLLGRPARLPGVPGPAPSRIQKLATKLRDDLGLQVELVE